jgi:hypothetical protein
LRSSGSRVKIARQGEVGTSLETCPGVVRQPINMELD